VKRFSALLDRLVFTPQRNAKIRLLREYFRTAPDPDRGYGLGALTGTLSFPHAKPALIRKIVGARVEPALFALSYDFVGDLAETTALIWPGSRESKTAPPLSEVVTSLLQAEKSEIASTITGWLNELDESGRYSLLKLITGGLRTGVSARMTKLALAEYGGVSINDVEEVWHGLAVPFTSLFSWLESVGDRPVIDAGLHFRPMMLASSLDDARLDDLDPGDYAAEWKWDGIRVQIVGDNGRRRIFSRTGDDITAAFPEIAETITFDAVLDGEMLVVRDGMVAPFNDLQQRLGRKAVTTAHRERYPCHVMVYDLLREGGEDLRARPFEQRRERLARWFARLKPARLELSPLVAFGDWSEIARLRAASRSAGIEGLMLKRRDSPYLAGRPKGPWFKLKRDPLTIDCVLMYAQRGHGRRSSFFSDFTFGCWRSRSGAPTELVPVGKTYFGFTDRELDDLDRWVRAHTIERFGPVRAVSPGLVLEIAFDAIHRSTRHKSGVAMRFPRVHRIRWDKPAAEADALDALYRLLPDGADPA
jgi:DNA ligase-1